MPHRSSRSRRYAGRAVVLSVLGWALFSRAGDDHAEKPVDERPFDFDVDWDVPELDVPEPAAAAEKAHMRTRPKRRLATSLAFATLFFAGAALSAGAGDMIAEAVESTQSTTTETTETVGETTSTEELPPVDTTPVEEIPTETEPAGEGDESTPPAGDGGEGGDGEAPGEGGQPGQDPGPGSEPGGGGSKGGDGSADGGAGNPGGDGGTSVPVPPGPPLIEADAPSGGVPAELDPEVVEAGSGATIWLNRTMPDPTPAARRLTSAFARTLKAESTRARADWALVLGVLRADGRISGVPASRQHVRRLASSLVDLGARDDEWAAVLALRGRTAFADRAVAGARLNRAVGLRALVTGLEAAKPALERAVLADSRLLLYPGGRDDVAANRIDIRVLVTVRYLAEAFGQVTVSSLKTGHRIYSRPGVVSAHTYGLAVDVAALGGLSMIGNQGPGSVTEQAVRSLLLLPPSLRPQQVISLIGMGGPSFAMANHADHIHVGF